MRYIIFGFAALLSGHPTQNLHSSLHMFLMLLVKRLLFFYPLFQEPMEKTSSYVTLLFLFF